MKLVYDYLCKGKASCIFPVISYTNMRPDWRVEALSKGQVTCRLLYHGIQVVKLLENSLIN
jgi:hypothetical protein